MVMRPLGRHSPGPSGTATTAQDMFEDAGASVGYLAIFGSLPAGDRHSCVPPIVCVRTTAQLFEAPLKFEPQSTAA